MVIYDVPTKSMFFICESMNIVAFSMGLTRVARFDAVGGGFDATGLGKYWEHCGKFSLDVGNFWAHYAEICMILAWRGQFGFDVGNVWETSGIFLSGWEMFGKLLGSFSRGWEICGKLLGSFLGWSRQTHWGKHVSCGTCFVILWVFWYLYYVFGGAPKRCNRCVVFWDYMQRKM